MSPVEPWQPSEPADVGVRGVQVRGGPGGTGADLHALLAIAGRLAAAAQQLTAVLTAVLAVAVDPVLLRSGLRSPGTFAGCERALLATQAGTAGLAMLVARLQACSLALRAAVAAYQAAEEAVVAGIRSARQRSAEAATRGALLALPAAATVTAGAAAARLAGHLGGEVTDLATGRRPARGDWDQDLAVRLSRALEATGEDLQATAGAWGNRSVVWLVAHPGITEQAVAGLPGVITALPAPAPAGRLWAVISGAPWPPSRVGHVAALLLGVGRVSPVLRDTPVRVGPAGSGPPRPARPPERVGDLVRRVCYQSDGRVQRGGTRPSPGQVRVERITGAEGTRAWVVEIPGTQSWNPVPQGTPMDVQTNGAALAGRSTAAESTVLQAMRRAGVPSSEPVLLAGHSQGGMTAAGLAAKARVRAEFHITHVLTTGSPVATMAVPPDVRVLSFEHRQDLVPRLDGAANPDAPHWTTVSRDLGRVDPADPLAAHDGLDYADTADLLDDLDAVREWRRSASVFFDRPGATSSSTDSVGARQLR